MTDDEFDERIDRLEKQFDEIHDMLSFISETMVKADTTITKIAAEVMPTINGLMESPMLKMLGGKRK